MWVQDLAVVPDVGSMDRQTSSDDDRSTVVGNRVSSSADSSYSQNRCGSHSLCGCVSASGPRSGPVVPDGGDDEVVGAVDDLEWSLETGLDAREIRAAGVRALAGGPFDGTVREDLANAGSVSYAVVDQTSLATQMTVVVSWHETRAHRRRVTLTVRGYVLRRPRLLGVLPVGRQTVPALGPARWFSSALYDRLDTSGA